MKNEAPLLSDSTPVNAVSGSAISDNTGARRIPIAVDLAHRSYISLTMLDTFLEDTPKVTQKQIDDLREKAEWSNFIVSCTGEEKGPPPTHKSSNSNEKEFKKLVQCIAGLDGLAKHFGERPERHQEELETCNPRWGHVRISHQGDVRMTTWNAQAR